MTGGTVRTLHGDARSVLAGWTARDDEPAQVALRGEFLEFLDGHDDAMWRACVDGHLTGSALVLSADRRDVLLTLHPKFGLWLQMGGHCEPGDATLAAAALREATEESGIPGLTLPAGGPVILDRHPIPAPCHWHLDVQYAAVAPPGAAERISDESLDLRWFAYDEVAGVADASVVRLLERTRDVLDGGR